MYRPITRPDLPRNPLAILRHDGWRVPVIAPLLHKGVFLAPMRATVSVAGGRLTSQVSCGDSLALPRQLPGALRAVSADHGA